MSYFYYIFASVYPFFSFNVVEYRCRGAAGVGLPRRGDEVGVEGDPRVGSALSDGVQPHITQAGW